MNTILHVNTTKIVQVCIEQGIFIQEKDMEVENDPLYNWSAATEVGNSFLKKYPTHKKLLGVNLFFPNCQP